MFGTLVQKLQTLSPISSPINSPVSSPKARRKFGGPRWRRQQAREEFREVQSEPELDDCAPSGKAKDKSKKKRAGTNRLSIGPPTLVSSSRDVSHYTLTGRQHNPVQFQPYGVVVGPSGHHQLQALPLHPPQKHHAPQQLQQMQQPIYQAVRANPHRQQPQPLQTHKPPQQQRLHVVQHQPNAPGFAPLHGSKSLGRLDGMKEVSFVT
jgi:hypothetical protein